MKQLIKSLLVIIAVFLVFSCEKALEPQIYTQLSPNNFFKTESDIKSAITPFYTTFGTDWGASDPGTGVYEFNLGVALNGYDYQSRMTTDQIVDSWNSAYSLFTFGPATVSLKSGQPYNKIRFIARATDIIDQISKCPLSEAQKDKYIAEVKTLRAWYMYILYDFYGPLNVKLDPSKLTSNEIEPRLSDQEYIAAIEKDLTEAMPYLADKYNTDNANWGRVSKGVARMILLKLHMHKKNWAKAEVVGNELVGMGYSLLPTYKDVFIVSANSESIYAFPGNPGILQYWYHMIMPGDADTVLKVKVQPGWMGEGMPWQFYDKYSAGDERLQTIADKYTTNKNQIKSRANGQLKAAIPMKYLNFKANNEGFQTIIYRYADVLLGMAEIENEINGPTPKAINFAKQVTDRCKTTIPASATLSKEAFRDFLLDERGRELYHEWGIRRQDLIRHGKFISSAISRGISAKEHQVLFAIPSDVIIEGNGVITQNPGYN